MNRILFFVLLLVITSVLLSSCKDELIVEENIYLDDSQYLPLDLGRYWEYSMDSITYDNFGSTIRNRSGFRKEQIVDLKEENASGEITYIVQVSSRVSLLEDWKPEKLIRIVVTTNTFTVVDDNLHFAPLHVPLVIGNTWETTLFDPENAITYVEGEGILPYLFWDGEVLERDHLLDLGLASYSTVKIQEADFGLDSAIPIYRRASTAYYAKEIGLVLREQQILDTQCFNDDPDCVNWTWEEKAYTGYILRQELIGYGQ